MRIVSPKIESSRSLLAAIRSMERLALRRLGWIAGAVRLVDRRGRRLHAL
jgi:hypothetical protein